MTDFIVTGCSEIVTLRGPVPRRGRAMRDLEIIRNGAIFVQGDRIAAVGTRRRIESLRQARRAEKLDLGGRVVLPGFVDSHTHLVFPASRADEYDQRITGKTYEQIARDGGGIRCTVEALRKATPEALKNRVSAYLRQFAAHGTTTIEAKSGYGLDWRSEAKILTILHELHQDQPLDIVRTFLGAHVVPQEYRRRPGDYVDLLVGRWIPSVATAGLADFCDVYCDRGAFTLAQARRILSTARACGLVPRIHAAQFDRTGAARLAIELRAASADHLDQINAADVHALALSNVVCTLLPGCSFHLGIPQCAPARELLDAGAIVSLATDFNPGTSPTVSMPMILSLACNQLRMTPAEAISAATINPAYSLRAHDRAGSIDVGKYADFAAFDVADYREIPYYFGVNLCSMTMKRGAVIHSQRS
ncbi:MAG: imidazolonepropionase [Candidatus Acidiferrales bacterium]